MVLYAKEHEWALIEGDEVTVGITNYAVEQLGDITFVELPSIGTMAEQNSSISFIESVKAASDIYSPLSGEIIEVNEELNDKPELINQDPEAKAWLFKIKMTNKGELDGLLSKDDYLNYLKTL